MKRCPLCCHGLRKNFGLFLAWSLVLATSQLPSQLKVF
jgi:hypothetical protein